MNGVTDIVHGHNDIAQMLAVPVMKTWLVCLKPGNNSNRRKQPTAYE